MGKNRSLPSSILFIILFFVVSCYTVAEGAGKEQRDGFFWMDLSKEEKHTWIDGYIAASVAATTWARISGIPEKSLASLMSFLQIF